MRKTKRCSETRIQRHPDGRLEIQTCCQERGHEGKHVDTKGGSWTSSGTKP